MSRGDNFFTQSGIVSKLGGLSLNGKSSGDAIQAIAHKVARSHFLWDDETIVFDDQSQPLKASLAQFSVGIAEFARILRLTYQALCTWKTTTRSERSDVIFEVLRKRLEYADKLHSHQVKNQTCHRSWRFDMYGPFKSLEVRALFESIPRTPKDEKDEKDLHLHPYIESGHIADLPSDFRDILLHVFKTMVADANGGDADNSSFDTVLFRLTQPECSNHDEMQKYLEQQLSNSGEEVRLIDTKGNSMLYREIVSTRAKGEQLNQLRRAIVIARTVLFGGQISLANNPSAKIKLLEEQKYDDTEGANVKENAKVTLKRITHVLKFLKAQKDLARVNNDLKISKMTWFHFYSLYVELFSVLKDEFLHEPPFDNGDKFQWFDEHSEILYKSICKELLQINEKDTLMTNEKADNILNGLSETKMMELRYAVELLLSRPYHSEKNCDNNVRSLNWTYCGVANCAPYNLMLVQERKSATC
jgi:hypothetical protein